MAEGVKNYLSAPSDRERPLYEQHYTDILRMFIFIFESNRHNCLPDDASGNR